MDTGQSLMSRATGEGKAFENALVDKLGKNDIVWDKSDFYDLTKTWLTYEEIVNDNRPLQTKNVLGVELATASITIHGRYTLDMVRIDSKIREVINEIKQEEAKIATRENAIADSAPQVSVAT